MRYKRILNGMDILTVSDYIQIKCGQRLLFSVSRLVLGIAAPAADACSESIYLFQLFVEFVVGWYCTVVFPVSWFDWVNVDRSDENIEQNIIIIFLL